MPLTVQVDHLPRNAVAGVAVTFTASTGAIEDAFAPGTTLTVQTDSSGQASIVLVPHSTGGTYTDTVTASVNALTATFTEQVEEPTQQNGGWDILQQKPE